MTDQKDNAFGFEEEGFGEEEFTIEESVPLAAPDAEMTGDVAEEFAAEVEGGAEPRKSSMTRILLLVLLLLVAGGGYFFFSTEAPESGGAAVKTAKQPISLPAKLSVKPAPTPVPAVAEPSVPAPIPPAAVTEPATKPVAKTATAASKPESSKPEAETAAAPVKLATAPVKVEPTPVVAKPTPVVIVPTPAPAAPQGDYSVRVGAYLLQSNLMNAQKMADQTGYLSQVEEARKLTKMTRLLYGRFSPAEATTKLAELRERSPAAFKVAEGARIAIYAGSYTSLDKARRYADHLYEKGVVLEEVAVEVPIPLYILKLGPFNERAAAEQAAKKAEAAGLPAQVVKKPVQ